MAHEIESIAYANAVPWHGIGNRVEENSTVEEMQVAAGLNWELERKPLLASLGDGEMLPIEGKSAWVRNTDRRVMAVSGPSWRPLQPGKTLEFMRDYVQAGAADDELLAQIHLTENQPKKLQQILASVEDAPGNKEISGTGWATLNGVTHWADHIYGHNAGTRMMRSWMGDNSVRKLEVEEKLLELAE